MLKFHKNDEKKLKIPLKYLVFVRPALYSADLNYLDKTSKTFRNFKRVFLNLG